MKKIFMAALLLLMLTLTSCGGDKQESKNVSSMKYSKVIVIGLDDEFAPMGFRNEQNEIVGFDVDLAKEAAKRLGVEFEFKPIAWDKKAQELQVRNIDIIWNGFDITPERREHVLYSKPYMDNRQILLVRRGNRQNIRSIYDIEGKVVGTQAGSTAEGYVEQDDALKNIFGEFKTYDTYKNAFKALEGGELDVLICDEIVARYEAIHSVDKFEAVGITIGPVTEFGIGFRKDDIELRNKVQKVFDDMIRDGTAKEISERWFQADLINSRR